jgi:hypothetical protein
VKGSRAKAVCEAADDLQKMDALIEGADFWYAIMRAECDPLFGRAARREDGMVSQVLHEHAASLSAASHANRSRRLTKCAKDSGHYRPNFDGRVWQQQPW